MQEQLPLSPAEFVKIRDGFIAFLKQPAGTPIELIIPKDVLDAMALAARRGRRQQPPVVFQQHGGLLCRAHRKLVVRS